MLSREIRKTFKNTCCEEHLRMTLSGNVTKINKSNTRKPFQYNVPLFYLLKTSENENFSNISRGVDREHWPEKI